ncbi:RICIN domain-containing protein [Streptomyces sp. NBS 14/10]|uniref:RICIN domain-containing protein n=1 Tax=Streptomyces sp. NBS 14/10 TaxID=1945643 RepID=UPI00211AC700|nr:RICIN domain-containing protein [Streptomyces sp. NBS 14/10]KAK1176798.1 RICIN domain-containing protein [Streptomyces sp. NBS 14/10]
MAASRTTGPGPRHSGGCACCRDGDRWFVGAFRRGGATISYPTTFLGSGTWHAEITTDGSDGLTRTGKVIQAGDTLSVPAVAGGGHVVRLTKVPAIPTGNRAVAIAGSSHVLDVKSRSLANDAEIIRWTSTGGTNQRFAFVPLGDGYTRIVNQARGKDVVIMRASRDAGTKAVQYPYDCHSAVQHGGRTLRRGRGRGPRPRRRRRLVAAAVTTASGPVSRCRCRCSAAMREPCSRAQNPLQRP